MTLSAIARRRVLWPRAEVDGNDEVGAMSGGGDEFGVALVATLM
jgi:hypothetical protein